MTSAQTPPPHNVGPLPPVGDKRLYIALVRYSILVIGKPRIRRAAKQPTSTPKPRNMLAS